MPMFRLRSGYKRRKQIIKPRLQFKIMLVFACMAACSVLLQSITLAVTMVSLADELPHDGNVLMDKMAGFLWINLLACLASVLTLHLLIGRTVTFKIAGPIHRFELYLKRLIRGERPGPCRIRKDDELQDFCEVLNEAVKPLSEPVEQPVDEDDKDMVDALEQPPAALGENGEAEGAGEPEREDEPALEK